MLLDLSKDRIVMYTVQEKIVVPFFEVERVFPEMLIKEYRQRPFTKLYCITGPGTFTNMRVAILAVQSLNYFVQGAVEYYAIDKLSLYHKLHHDGVLARYGVMMIGQRKRLALFDARQNTYEAVLYQDILTRLQNPNDEMLSEDNFFVDDCYGEDFVELQTQRQVIALSYENTIVSCTRDNKKTDISDAFVSVPKLEAFYLS